MTPKEYKQMMDYLTRSGVRKQVKFASDIARPDPKPQVKEIELFNKFNRRNPKADGGMLVQPGFGGTRQGYSEAKGEITLKSMDVINIKDIKKYNKNLLNKAITLGDPNKPGINQADKVTLQNIFDVVKRTKDGDVLINNFKKNPNAETLQKLKRRRKNRLMFEKQQALPPLEKAELRKRKRISEQKWRNSGKGIKYYNNYLSQGGIFPARTAEERVWRDIYRASKQKKGESRFIIKYPKSANVDKISGLPQTVTSKLTGNDYIPWDKFYKDITFYDTVSKKNIKFNTVKKWMTDNVQDGARKYDNAIKNYKASNVINTFEVDGVALSKLAKDKQKGDFIKRITTAAAVNHRSGLNNFWDTEVTTSSGNKMLNDKVQANIKAYKNASNPNIEKKLLNIMKQNAKKIEGGGTIVLDDKITLGKKPTVKSVVSALEKELDVKIPLKKIVNQIAVLGGEDCGRIRKYQGGRIGLQDGTPNVDVCFKKAIQRINSGFKNATPAEARNYTKLLNAVKGSAVIGRNLLKFGIVPEALYVGADSLIRMGFGDTFEEAGLRASDFFIPGDQMQEADKLKVQRTLGDAAATNVGKVFDYRNQIANIDSLEQQKANLENLSNVGEFDYIGDLSQDVKNIDTRLNQAKNDLQNKFMVSEAETVAADRALEEAYDISKAKSPLARLKSFAQNIEAVQDDPFLSDITSPEKTQMDLNLNMFPTAIPTQTDFMKMTDTDIMNRRRDLINAGVTNLPSSRDLMSIRDAEIADREKRIDEFKAMPLMDAANQFGREQVFGTQGTFFGQPLAGGGIAKLAGDRSGPPPEKGPMSQGLPGLLKRVRNL